MLLLLLFLRLLLLFYSLFLLTIVFIFSCNTYSNAVDTPFGVLRYCLIVDTPYSFLSLVFA